MVIATQGTRSVVIATQGMQWVGLHDNELGFTGVDSEELTQANVSQCLHSVCMGAEWCGWCGVEWVVVWVEWSGVGAPYLLV